MAGIFDLFKPTRGVTKRGVGTTSMQKANIDTTGMDPEMQATIGQEATRRVAFGGGAPADTAKKVSFGNNVMHFIEAHNPFAGKQ